MRNECYGFPLEVDRLGFESRPGQNIIFVPLRPWEALGKSLWWSFGYTAVSQPSLQPHSHQGMVALRTLVLLTTLRRVTWSRGFLWKGAPHAFGYVNTTGSLALKMGEWVGFLSVS